MTGHFSEKLDGCELWSDLYDFQNEEAVQVTSQQIGTAGYCDVMTVRLFFSEQQAAFCIVTNKESIRAYTGAREFVSELYKVSANGIALRRHWMQNTVENLNYSPDYIIAEMQRVGIPYMDMIYFNFGLENKESPQEQILFQNTVEVEGEFSAERTYELYFTIYDELNAEMKGSYLFVKARNTSEKSHALRKRRKSRAYGTQILQELVRTYEGNYQAGYEKGWYTAVVMVKAVQGERQIYDNE